jgi:hypothetical protein
VRAACLKGARNAHRILIGMPERRKPLGRRRCRWEDNIEMNIKEIDWEDVN